MASRVSCGVLEIYISFDIALLSARSDSKAEDVLAEQAEIKLLDH
jgi:hypothetical protein